MRPTALTTLILTCMSGLLGIVATLSTLFMVWSFVGSGFGANPLRFSHSILDLIAVGATTVTLFAGAVLLGRRDPRGRTLVIAGSASVIVLSLIEFGVWAASSQLNELWIHRWVWFALSIVTLIVTLLAGNESRSAAHDPESVAPQTTRAVNLLIAALAVAMAAYHLSLTKKQFDFGWHHITTTGLVPTTPSATWALAMFEPLGMSVLAAVTLVVGAVLISVGAAAGRVVVIAGCILTVAQGILGWTDLDRLFYEIGATDLLTIFAPRTASVVVLTLTVPVVTAVLAAAAPARAPRT